MPASVCIQDCDGQRQDWCHTIINGGVRIGDVHVSARSAQRHYHKVHHAGDKPHLQHDTRHAEKTSDGARTENAKVTFGA